MICASYLCLINQPKFARNKLILISRFIFTAKLREKSAHFIRLEMIFFDKANITPPMVTDSEDGLAGVQKRLFPAEELVVTINEEPTATIDVVDLQKKRVTA